MPARSAKTSEDAVEAALPAADMERLRALDSRVMAWLAASDANRLLFTNDPVAALLQIDKTLDKTFVRQLQRSRQARGEATPVDARIRLKDVRLSAGKAVAARGKATPTKR